MAHSEQRTAKIINVTKNGYNVHGELQREWVWRRRVDSIYHIPEEFCSPLTSNSRYTKEMPRVLDPFRFLLIALAGWMNQRQQLAINYLREENRVLREQLGG